MTEQRGAPPPSAKSPAAKSIDTRTFARLMARFAPFESAPMLAVAVSGGADSMALALLADRWARKRGGAVAALTVDHRLRRGSGAEARRVAAWMKERGIRHHVLRRVGDAPVRNVQAAARQARYGRLTEWCRRHGVLHLLLAHHRDDQAETVLLRLARGSGVDGLAAMSPVSESADVRLLRPLLDVPRDRIFATLAVSGQAWIEDPSNRDPAFARVRARALLRDVSANGLTVDRLAGTARRMARARVALEADVAALLAAAVTLHPMGFAWLDNAILAAAPEEIALRALAGVLRCVGGATYTPRLDGVERLHAALCGGSTDVRSGYTLSGCRVLRRRGAILVCRETAAAVEVVAVAARRKVRWDDRFEIGLGGGRADDIVIRRLGRDGWRMAVSEQPALGKSSCPPAVRTGLPALWAADRLVEVPHLEYRHDSVSPGILRVRSLRFAPKSGLTGSAFALV